MTEEYDAVIIGAGHNGLAAGVVLARAGWKVVVLERNAEPGGAVRTGEATLPGFRHDLYATGVDAFVSSAFYREFGGELLARGFSAVRAERGVGSVFPGGGFLGVSIDERETLDGIRSLSSRDCESWLALQEEFWAIAPYFLRILGRPMPSVGTARALVQAHFRLHGAGVEQIARLALQSSRDVTQTTFERPELHALFGAWGMHLDFPPEMPGGAFFTLLKTFGAARSGTTLSAGGAQNLIGAMVLLLESLGGQVVTGADVKRVLLRGGRAIGVETGDGRRWGARRAVIANVTPQALVTQLLDGSDLAARDRASAAGYRFGPGTMMVHLALDAPVPWASGKDVAAYSYVHVGPFIEDMSLAYHQATAGLIPERPTLVVGQPTAIDPSRAPEGKHILWVEVRVVPSTILADAAAEISATDWDEAKEFVADRVLALLDEHAPGLRSLVIGRHVISPLDLERANPNLVGGDTSGGSHHPMQNFFLRPLPGWGRYRTPVDRLYICGASTWPGAGLGAGPGYLLATTLTRNVSARLRVKHAIPPLRPPI